MSNQTETDKKSRKGSTVTLYDETLELLDKLRGGIPRGTYVKMALEYFERTGYDVTHDNADTSRFDRIAEKYENALTKQAETIEQTKQLTNVTARILTVMGEIQANKNLLLPPTEIALRQIEENNSKKAELNILEEKIKSAKKQLNSLKKQINAIITLFD